MTKDSINMTPVYYVRHTITKKVINIPTKIQNYTPIKSIYKVHILIYIKIKHYIPNNVQVIYYQ